MTKRSGVANSFYHKLIKYYCKRPCQKCHNSSTGTLQTTPQLLFLGGVANFQKTHLYIIIFFMYFQYFHFLRKHLFFSVSFLRQFYMYKLLTLLVGSQKFTVHRCFSSKAHQYSLVRSVASTLVS